MKDQPVPAEVRRRVGVSIAVPHHLAGAGALMVPRSALSREVGVATEMLLTKAEQVWDDGAPPGYAYSGHACPATALTDQQQRRRWLSR
jgi:hypothetical protein